jgi:hypothetical protein
LIANWPGHLSYDSEVQLLEGRQAVYANWHPYAMSWLLGIFDAVLPGTGLFVTFDTLLLFGGLLSLSRLPGKKNWATVLVAFVCIASPQFFLYPGIVWKDVLFAALAVAGHVCLVNATVYWRLPRPRFALLTLCFFLLSAAALVRQNGIVLLPPAVVALAGITARRSSGRDGLLYGLAGIAVAAIVALAAQALLGPRVHGHTGPAAQFRLLQTYDLVGALKSSPGYRLDVMAASDPSLTKNLRANGVSLYSAERNDTLSNSKSLLTALGNAKSETIAEQWRDLAFRHTGLYLKTRAEIFRWVFLAPNLSACVPYMAGVDGPPGLLRALGIPERMDARDMALKDYAATFLGTPLLSHAASALLAVGALAFLLYRRRDADIVIAAMLTGGLIFTLTFFFISIACDYRYLYFLDVAALISLFYLTLDSPISKRRAER